MRLRTRRRQSVMGVRLVAIAVAAAGIGVLSPATAIGLPSDGSPTDEEVQVAIQRISQGQGSDADRAVVESVPGLADQVVDPTMTEISDVLTTDDAVHEPSGVAGVSCSRADRYTVYRSLSGMRHFDWHMWVRWCYTGRQIYGAPTRGDYIARYDAWTVNLRSPVRNGHTYGPNYVNVDVWMQGHVEICIIRYGCYGNYYPHTRYHLGNNGSYQIQQWK